MSGQTTRKGALLDSGTPSPNPWDLSLSRQNGCSTMEALERRIGLRRDATRAPIQGPEWQGAGFPSRPQNSTPRPRRALAYCGQKMVLTMGSTLIPDIELGDSISVNTNSQSAVKPRQRLKPFEALAEMLLKHLDGIVNYCRTKVRFGVVEALNGNIRMMINRGRGYQNLRYLLLKVKRLAVTNVEFIAVRSLKKAA
jgi:hypothetical protein